MKSLISWFAHNHVAANLFMVLILVSGGMILPLMERAIIPNIEFDRLTVWAGYPGAGPTQVERAVSRKIEASLVGVDGIVDMVTEAKKGVSVTEIRISNQYRVGDVLNKVRARIEAVGGLPKGAARPVVTEVVLKEPVMMLALSGELDLFSLNNIAAITLQQLSNVKGVSLAVINRPPRRHISVELSESNLQKYQITFSQVVGKIRSMIVDVSGASLKTDEGEVSIIGESKIKNGDDFEDLVLRGYADGARITLSDVARVDDEYLINEAYKRFDGDQVVYLAINRASDEDLLTLAQTVYRFVEQTNQTLPDGVTLKVISDVSEAVSGRIDMLAENAVSGFILLFVVLLLFLNLRLSFWTSLGIPISFLGAFFFLYFWGGTLNMVSLFAFILVLGIVVDDAIIVGESIYSQHEQGRYGVQPSIDGALEVATPVIFAVLTTMIAFAPMLFMPGEEGRLIMVVPVVVISVLAFSLIESLLILPAHLSTIKKDQAELIPALTKLQTWFSSKLEKFIHISYKPILELALQWRYAALAIFFGIFLFSIALLAGRWIPLSLVSSIESDMVIARLAMVEGSSLAETEQAIKRLEEAAKKLQAEVNEELGFKQIIHVSSSVVPNSQVAGDVTLYLDTTEEREIVANDLSNAWQKSFGEVPHLKALTFTTSIIGAGPTINVELSHHDVDELKKASEELQQLLKGYDGVISAWDTMKQGKKEVSFDLKPEADDMGVSLAQIANQIRQVFHGDQVQIRQTGGAHVGVTIAFPKEQRQSLWYLENMKVLLKDGTYVPLYMVAELTHREGPSVIRLHNGKRVIGVQAKLDRSVTFEGKIMAAIRRDMLSDLVSKYPGMTWGLAGGQKRSEDVFDYLVIGYSISLLVMYLLMATLFSSYTQPLIVMYAIPFGIIGALLGHLIMGEGVTLWSLVGMIAVSGVVVNDNLVLVDRINHSRERGLDLFTAIRDAGVARFRPIVLTSLTTFLGLAPIMMEDSVQAQFLVPMAISIAFGVAFATAISLLLVPALYSVLSDIKNLLIGIRNYLVTAYEGYAQN